MTNNYLLPPLSDELEVSVFGPGVGEAIAVHIGGGHWVLVDSCRFPRQTLPLSLRYLYDLNVDVETSVILVVATHWHQDHIRGMDVVLERCKNAQFVITGAARGEFLDLIKLYDKTSVPEYSSTRDVSKVFEVLIHNKRTLKHAISDRVLLHKFVDLDGREVEASVHSLSPSDDTIGIELARVSKMLKEGSPARELHATNHPSVVLWVRVGNYYILLGGDLERTKEPGTGWSAILEKSLVVSSKAQVFKIPHHGSENAHHPDIWDLLLESQPVAAVTPFRSGKNPLPSHNDRTRIVSLTPHAYSTAPTSQSKVKLRDRGVARSFREATKWSNDLYRRSGQVRFRKKIDAENNNWQVNLFGSAYQMT